MKNTCLNGMINLWFNTGYRNKKAARFTGSLLKLTNNRTTHCFLKQRLLLKQYRSSIHYFRRNFITVLFKIFDKLPC